jgi:hypothetical protein
MPLLVSGIFYLYYQFELTLNLFMIETAQQLAALYENICIVGELIRDRIEDECDSSEDFDNHYLADEYSLLRKVDQILKS